MLQRQMPTNPNQCANTVKNVDIINFSVPYRSGKKIKLKALKTFLEMKTVAPITLSQKTIQTQITTNTNTETA